jgi:CRISPR/Cas system CSM-associated protein Csm3 (group 7 of RAMP superfamily)
VIRDGVGIDRPSGAAARAAAAKFAVETLPAGAAFELRMELREPDAGQRVEDEQLLAAALAEWQAGRAHLGGDVARGLGAFTLEGIRHAEYPLDEAEGLMAFLGSSTPWEGARPDAGWLQRRLDEATARIVPPEELPQEVPFSRGWAEWTFTLQAEGPFLTNDATSAGISGFDHAPLLATVGDWARPVLAGSSLRGVLRAHAERIARTLATRRAMGAADPKADFLHRCPTCDPLAHTSPNPLKQEDSKPTEVPLESCDSLLRRRVGHDENTEVEEKQLCLACRLFGSTRNGSRLIVEDAPYAGDDLPAYKMLDFLAIDRFTGGGAEHFKFDALALWQPRFHVRIFLEDPQRWELGWLTLALRDLAEGWLRVGFGAAKGFGKVVATEITLRRGRLDAAQVDKGQPSIYSVDEQTFGNDWTSASEWVEAFVDRVEQFERDDDMDLPADSYFGAVDHVYEGGVS